MIIPAIPISSTHALFGRAGGTRVPPEVIASWPTPNYHSPEERGLGAPIALSMVLAVTLLVYVARMWTRLTMTKNAGVDDVLISIAVIPLAGLTISAILGVKVFGFQWHIWDQTAKTKKTTRFTSMSIELNYMICTTLIKISILFFYRRLTGSLTNRFVHAVWACIAICVTYFIIFVVLTFFTCSFAKGRKNCVEEGAFIVAVTAFSAVQDLVICSLPAFLITGLQMPKRQKLALCGIFGLGFVTTVCGIMRMYYAIYVYYFTYDVTWYAYYGWIWTVLEANLGLICASAPALRVFFRHSLGLMSYTGTFRSGGHKTPVHKSQSPKTPVILLSAREVCSVPSASSARGTDMGDHIYLDSIVVERGLSSKVEERDDASQRSDSSTKNLTTIIYGPLSK